METNQIVLQNEPAYMQDVVEISSPEQILETSIEEPALASESEPELVDFYLTEPATESLKGILAWSRILFGCLLFFMFIEVLFLVISMAGMASSAIGFFSFLRSAISLSINGFVVWQNRKFNVQMQQALNYNDTLALTEAFGRQALYFKWVFINILVAIGNMILNVFI